MSETLIEVTLHEIAHSRSGDKGDRANVSIIPYDEETGYAPIAEQVPESRMLESFRHRGATEVRRYDLPNLGAFNYVIDDVLQGGSTHSLNLDGLGKTLSYYVLMMKVRVSPEVLSAAKKARDN